MHATLRALLGQAPATRNLLFVEHFLQNVDIEQLAELAPDLFESSYEFKAEALIEVHTLAAPLGHSSDKCVETEPPGLVDRGLLEFPADAKSSVIRLHIERSF